MGRQEPEGIGSAEGRGHAAGRSQSQVLRCDEFPSPHRWSHTDQDPGERVGMSVQYGREMPQGYVCVLQRGLVIRSPYSLLMGLEPEY